VTERGGSRLIDYFKVEGIYSNNTDREITNSSYSRALNGFRGILIFYEKATTNQHKLRSSIDYSRGGFLVLLEVYTGYSFDSAREGPYKFLL
jgi:hypothetical protein